MSEKPRGSDDMWIHRLEPDRHDHWTVRIATPGYNPDDEWREITTGFFQGDVRGLLVRARPADIRVVGELLIEAADRIEGIR